MYSPGFIVVKFDHFGINPVFKPIEFDGFRKQAGLNTMAITQMKSLISVGGLQKRLEQ